MATKQVRWLVQASQPGMGNWVDRPEIVYSGWFGFDGEAEPSETVLAQYEQAVSDNSHLDLRLIQNERTWHTVIIKQDFCERNNAAR